MLSFSFYQLVNREMLLNFTYGKNRTVEVPIPNSVPNEPLPSFASALLLSPLTHLIFLFLSPIFLQVFSFTM